MDVTIPTNQVPQLPAGYFFRVIKVNDLGCDFIGVEIRKKLLFIFSTRVDWLFVRNGASKVFAEDVTENDILATMTRVVNVWQASIARYKRIEEQEARVSKLLGNYPPKKIIR